MEVAVCFAVLEGYALRAVGLPYGDHTYVRSQRGDRWGCWGRDSGGSLVCAGEGDWRVADCLSQPNSQAGIVYGITGVCHQTANRILWPAGVLVSAAKGYGASAFAFGVYGIGAWPEKAACANQGCTAGTTRGVTRDTVQMGSQPHKPYARRIRDLHERAEVARTDRDDLAGEIALANAELEAAFNSFLGRTYNRDKRRAVVGVQASLREEQRSLRDDLAARRMQKKVYFAILEHLQSQAFKACEIILGERDFEKLFGGTLADVTPRFTDQSR